jgi:hypothetical protein
MPRREAPAADEDPEKKRLRTELAEAKKEISRLQGEVKGMMNMGLMGLQITQRIQASQAATRLIPSFVVRPTLPRRVPDLSRFDEYGRPVVGTDGAGSSDRA